MQRDPELSAAVEACARRLAQRRVGVVVAAVRGPAAEIRGAGSTGRGDGLLPGPGTAFEIGSVTKVFTALALARQVTSGRLALDQPVVELLPAGVRVPTFGGQQILLRHLATHTSGLPRLPAGMMRHAVLHPRAADPYAACSAEMVFESLARTRLRAVPGERMRYSNLGAGLLGTALAHHAGNGLADGAYDALIRPAVCEPLGLCETQVHPVPGLADRVASGHDRRGRPVPPWFLHALDGAGGLRSTAADLVRFLRAQLDPDGHELADAVRLTHQVRHPPADRPAWVHLGWMGLALPASRDRLAQLWHSGGTGGFRTWVGMIPERRTGALVLGNTSRSVDRAGFDLLRAITFGR